MPNNQIKIGYIKSPARKGDRITVYFANGKPSRFVANNDLTSTQVVVIGDRAFSQDAAQQKLAITTRLFKSRTNYDDPQKYPFLSVFINSNSELVATYNGGQRILGNIPFSQLAYVNLNHKGNAIFAGTALSKSLTQVISFDNKEIKPVVNIAINSNVWKTISFLTGGDNPGESNPALQRRQFGNKIYDCISTDSDRASFNYAIKYLPQKQTFIHKKYLAPFAPQTEMYYGYQFLLSYGEPLNDIQGYFDLSGSHFQYDEPGGEILFSQQVSLWRFDPTLSRQVLTIAPQNYIWSDNRTIDNYGTNPSSFSNGGINWSYKITGHVVTLNAGERTGLYPIYPSYQGNTNQPPPVTDTFSGALVKSITNQADNNSNIAIEFPSVYNADGSILGNTKITYKSNISRVAKYDSSFAVSGTAVTAWQHVFSSGFGYYYEPYTNTNIYYSGQANCSDTTERHIEAELLIPVPVCNRRIVERRKYLKRDYFKTTSASLTVNNSQIYTNYISSSPIPINNYTTVSQDTISYENLDIDFNFNVGDLGIYREKKLAYVIKEDFNGLISDLYSRGRLITAPDSPPPPSAYQTTFNHIELSATLLNYYNYDPPELFNHVTASKTTFNYSAYNTVKTKSISANFSFYKIAYLDNEPITAYPGFVFSSYTSTPEKIANFFLDSNSDPTIDLNLYRTQNTNYVSEEKTTVTKSVNQTPQDTTNYVRQSYPPNEINNFNLEGELVVYKQTYQDNTYLALCRINSALSSSQTNYGNTSNNPDSKYLSSAQCTIISVKKIKPFGYGNTFGSNPLDASIFTVDGCAIFQFLDPYKTNLITVENDSASPDVYLAATVPTIPPPSYKPVVTEKDTQALLFKLTDTGFTFVAVVGGDISDPSQEKSPDAAYWIKYWERPVTSYF